MQISDELITSYVKVVCEQIRFKKAHTGIKEELTNHIIDSRNSYIAQGLDEEAATQLAIIDTGDAVFIGTEFDRIHRPNSQFGMLFITLALLLTGTVLQAFLSHIFTYNTIPPYSYLYSLFGILVMVIAYFFDFSLLGKYPKLTYFTIMSIAIISFYVSPILNGRVMHVTFLTLLFPLAFAVSLFSMKGRGYKGLLFCLLSYILPVVITVTIPSTLSMLLSLISNTTLLLVAARKNWFGIKHKKGYLLIFSPWALLFSVFLYYIARFPYIRYRFLLIFTPEEKDYFGPLIQNALAQVQIFGSAMPVSEIDIAFPYSHDFFLIRLLLYIGWFIPFVILCILFLFIIKGFLLCLKQKNMLGKFISLSILITFTIQSISYIGVNLGIFTFLFAPLTLPLLSYGNLANIINLGLIGIMLSVFRTGHMLSNAPKMHGNIWVS